MSELDRRLASEVEAASPPDPPAYAEVLTRRHHRRQRRRALLACAGAVVLVGAVVGGTTALSTDDPDTAPPASHATTTPTGDTTDVPFAWDEQQAPPVMLQLDGREVRLDPYTSCYSAPPGPDGVAAGQCVDGFSAPPYEDVGDRREVSFAFPLRGWRFEATFRQPEAGRCSRSFTVRAESTDDHTFRMPAAGAPGAYLVDLFGQGPEGDVAMTFAWTTTAPGVMPEPYGFAQMVSQEDDHYVAYGLEVVLNDLATEPRDASATFTVTAADGATRTIGPLAPERECTRDGSLRFTQFPDKPGDVEPFDLGPGPFTYSAEVILDGQTYVGTGVWPRDQTEEPPYTALQFSPPLPTPGG